MKQGDRLIVYVHSFSVPGAFVPENGVVDRVNGNGTGIAIYPGNSCRFNIKTMKVLYWHSDHETGEYVRPV